MRYCKTQIQLEPFPWSPCWDCNQIKHGALPYAENTRACNLLTFLAWPTCRGTMRKNEAPRGFPNRATAPPWHSFLRSQCPQMRFSKLILTSWRQAQSFSSCSGCSLFSVVSKRFRWLQEHPMGHTETSWLVFSRFVFTRHQKSDLSLFDSSDSWNFYGHGSWRMHGSWRQDDREGPDQYQGRAALLLMRHASCIMNHQTLYMNYEPWDINHWSPIMNHQLLQHQPSPIN